MVDVQVDKSIFNIDDKPTLENYNAVINKANEILDEVRGNVYALFLGPKSQAKAIILLFFTFLISRIFSTHYLYYILFFEILIYFVICLILSEFFTQEIKGYINEEIKQFKEKYAPLVFKQR